VLSIDWRPGIGDPTFMGWLTVCLYLVAAAFSAVSANRAQLSGTHWKIESLFWLCLGVLCFALAINKQFDFQTLFTEVGRYIAKEGGWYTRRREVQEGFIHLISITSFLSILVVLAVLRNTRFPVRVAVVGISFVLCFVVIRAASFHRVDAFLAQTVIGLRWNWIFEVTGILIIVIAAQLYLAAVPQPAAKAKTRQQDTGEKSGP
jgi:hypothetical protein